MRLNNGVSKVVSLGLTILVTLLSLLLLFGVTDTVKEIISVSRGSYSSYSEDSLFRLREEGDYNRLWRIWQEGNFAVTGAGEKQAPYLSAGRYFHDAMLEKALENGGEAYADEADRLNMRLEEEAAAMHDEECRKEIDEIIRKGAVTYKTAP